MKKWEVTLFSLPYFAFSALEMVDLCGECDYIMPLIMEIG